MRGIFWLHFQKTGINIQNLKRLTNARHMKKFIVIPTESTCGQTFLGRFSTKSWATKHLNVAQNSSLEQFQVSYVTLYGAETCFSRSDLLLTSAWATSHILLFWKFDVNCSLNYSIWKSWMQLHLHTSLKILKRRDIAHICLPAKCIRSSCVTNMYF